AQQRVSQAHDVQHDGSIHRDVWLEAGSLEDVPADSPSAESVHSYSRRMEVESLSLSSSGSTSQVYVSISRCDVMCCDLTRRRQSSSSERVDESGPNWSTKTGTWK